MKIKNLLLVPLLSAALVATSCSPAKGGDSTSGSDTSGESQKVVTRVTVKQVSSVIVGDVLDFDTLVDVYYDDESTGKDYTLEAAVASKDLVKIEGNKVTILAEGSISINVKAGEQQAKFNSTALSQLKKDVYDAFKDVSNNYKVEITTDEANYSLRKIHRPNYVYIPDYPDGGLANGFGYMKFATGRGYQYEVASSVVTVGDPINYDNYFATMDLDLKVLETTTMNAEGVDFLRLGSNVATDWHEYGYFNHAHFVVYSLTGLSLPDVYYNENDEYLNPIAGTEYYRWEQIDISAKQDGEGNKFYYFSVSAAQYVVAPHDDPTEEYEYFGENDQIKEGEAPFFQFGMKITPLAAEDEGSAIVEAVVNDPDKEPVTKDYSKLQEAYSDKCDAAEHNYTVVAQSAFIDKLTGTNRDVVVETFLVNEDVYDYDVQITDDGEDVYSFVEYGYQRHWGYAVRNEKLYTYKHETGASQVVEGKTSIYGDAEVKADTFASLSNPELWSSFFVQKVEEDSENHRVAYTLTAGRSVDFLVNILNLTDAGATYVGYLETYIAAHAGWYESLEEGLAMNAGFGGGAAITLQYDDSDTNVLAMQLQLLGFLEYTGRGYIYFQTAITISSFGSTAAVDLSDITF